jgi:hypothetical protein
MFNSCSSSDDELSSIEAPFEFLPLSESQILGSWVLTDYIIPDGKLLRPDENPQSNQYSFIQEGTVYNQQINFDIGINDDQDIRTTSFLGDYSTDTMLVRQDGLTETFSQQFQSIALLNGSWSIVDQKLIITDGESLNFEIEAISYDIETLTFRVKLPQANTQLPDGITISGYAYFSMVKII